MWVLCQYPLPLLFSSLLFLLFNRLFEIILPYSFFCFNIVFTELLHENAMYDKAVDYNPT